MVQPAKWGCSSSFSTAAAARSGRSCASRRTEHKEKAAGAGVHAVTVRSGAAKEFQACMRLAATERAPDPGRCWEIGGGCACEASALVWLIPAIFM